MKKLLVAVIALAMMVSALAVMADGEKSFTITPRVAANIALDKDTKDYIATGQYGILADIDVASLPVGFETGFLWGNTKKNNFLYWWDYTTLTDGYVAAESKVKSWNIPLLVTYEYPITDQFYAKAGVGVNFFNVKTDVKAYAEVDDGIGGKYEWKDGESYKKTKCNFAFKLGVGYKFAQNLSAELFYNNAGKVKLHDHPAVKADTGSIDNFKTSFIQLNVGYSF